MKKSIKVITSTALLLSAISTQAHISEDMAHTHEQSQMRSTIQAMSPADRLNFKDAMHRNLESMSAEDRQAFKDTMRKNHGMGANKGEGMGKQHQHDGSLQGTGQGNKFMHGGSHGGGYGRGYGKR